MALALSPLDVIERGTVELVDESHVRAVLAVGSELQSKSFFTVTVKNGKYYLTAGKYIGVIPIGRDLTLRINSKVPTARLVNVLTIARESPIVIRLLERYYQPGTDRNVFELLILALHGALPTLIQHGPIRQYQRRCEVGQTLRGSPRFRETVTRLWSRAAFDRASYEIFELSPDNYLNKAIEYTLWHVQRVLLELPTKMEARILRDFSDAHRMFAAVTPDRTRSFLPDLRAHLQHTVMHEPFVSFRPLLSLCRMILDDLGVDLNADAVDPVVLVPMVIDMETVFQRFLLNALTKKADQDGRLACWDTATEQQMPLFRESTTAVPTQFLPVTSQSPAQPDFTLAVGGRPVLVGDAKYKTHRDVDDVYQAVSHAAAYGVNDVLLVYPASDLSAGVTFSSLGNVGEVRVFVARFPLDADDLDDAVRNLFGGICELIATRDTGFAAAGALPVISA